MSTRLTIIHTPPSGKAGYLSVSSELHQLSLFYLRRSGQKKIIALQLLQVVNWQR